MSCALFILHFIVVIMNLKSFFQSDFVKIDELQNALQLHVKNQNYAVIRDRIINDTKTRILLIT